MLASIVLDLVAEVDCDDGNESCLGSMALGVCCGATGLYGCFAVFGVLHINGIVFIFSTCRFYHRSHVINYLGRVSRYLSDSRLWNRP